MTTDGLVIAWHDAECGAYRADLPLWRELADGGGRAGARPRLRLGARCPGPGRGAATT